LVAASTVVEAQDGVSRGTATGSAVPPAGRPSDDRPVTDTRSEHELKLHRGWISVERELELRDLDRKALEVRDQAERPQQGEGPSLAPDGSIQFVYGEGVPTVFCRPLTVCDIALQEGERVVNYRAGTGQGGAWMVGLAYNQADPALQPREPHVHVQPKRPTAENTTLTIWTDRRTYHLDLIAAETPMRFVSFRYPEDDQLDLFVATGAAGAARDAAPGAGEPRDAEGPFSPRPWEWRRNYESDCASRFWVCRDIKWMAPEDVTDDGNVTQITLPVEALSHPRPVFHVISPTGERVEVNYTLHGRTYIVPQVFDEGALVIVHGKRRRHVWEYRIRRVQGED
jgi:type IV secretion system protein VirB9